MIDGPQRRIGGRLARAVRLPPRPGLVRVRGRSMEPTLVEGDLLVVLWGARPRVGRLAVVDLPGGRPLAVKRLTSRQREGWWAERDNPREGVDSWALGAVPDAGVRAVVLFRLPRWRR